MTHITLLICLLVLYSLRADAFAPLSSTRFNALHQLSMNNKEQTYIMIKPDGVQRGVVGNIIGRFEQKGYLLKAMKLSTPSQDTLAEHYKDLADKPFFPKLMGYMTSGPVVCMVKYHYYMSTELPLLCRGQAHTSLSNLRSFAHFLQ